MIFLFSSLPQYKRLQVFSPHYMQSIISPPPLPPLPSSLLPSPPLPSPPLAGSGSSQLQETMCGVYALSHRVSVPQKGESHAHHSLCVILYLLPVRCFCPSKVSIIRLKYRGKPSLGSLRTTSLRRHILTPPTPVLLYVSIHCHSCHRCPVTLTSV